MVDDDDDDDDDNGPVAVVGADLVDFFRMRCCFLETLLNLFVVADDLIALLLLLLLAFGTLMCLYC